MTKKKIKKSDISWPINYKHCFHISFDENSQSFTGVPPQWSKFISKELIEAIKSKLTSFKSDDYGSCSEDSTKYSQSIKQTYLSSTSSSTNLSKTSTNYIIEPTDNRHVNETNKEQQQDNFKIDSTMKNLFITKSLIEDIKNLIQFKQSTYAKYFIGVHKVSSIQVHAKCLTISSQQQIDSIFKQTEILSKISHENIIKFIGSYYETDGLKSKLSFVTEFAPNGSLSDLITNGANFDDGILAYLSSQILNGLKYIHSKNIIHTNIMSDVILFDSFAKPKITDFSNAQNTLTNSRSTVGTVYWMSPEMLNGSSYSTEVDIWAFGMVLVEIVDGEPLNFSLEPNRAIELIKSTKNPLKPIKTVSSTTENFINHCLTPNVNQRYTATQLLSYSAFLSKQIKDNEFRDWFYHENSTNHEHNSITKS